MDIVLAVASLSETVQVAGDGGDRVTVVSSATRTRDAAARRPAGGQRRLDAS